jgi:DNA-binding transcriptional LysR family regulator
MFYAWAAAARGSGTLRVGFTVTTGGEAVTRLVTAFQAAHPGCQVILQEIGLGHPLASRPSAAAEDLADFELAAGPAVPAQGPLRRPAPAADTLRQADPPLIPVTGMPPLQLGLIWCTAHENARIRSLAQTAATLSVEPHRRRNRVSRPGLPPG